MQRTKRKAENEPSESPGRKRSKRSDVITIPSDDEEDISTIWAEIQAMEQQQSTAIAGPSRDIPPNGTIPSALVTSSSAAEDDDVSEIWAQIQAQEQAAAVNEETDEEMARRLAAEWEANDRHYQTTEPIDSQANIPRPSSSHDGKSSCSVITCCADVRAIALFEALSALDRNHLGSKGDPGSSKPSTKKGKNAVTTTGKGGTGYGVASRYGPHAHHRLSDPESSMHENPAHSNGLEPNIFVVRTFELTSQLLPKSSSEEVYDLLPNPIICPLLQLSYLPEILRELLRNDSVEEWSRQSQTYQAMIELLQRLADSELSVELLTMQSWEKRTSAGLDEFVWGTGPLELEAIKQPSRKKKAAAASTTSDGDGRGPPLYEFFTKLVRLCDAFLSLVAHDNGGNDDETEEHTVQAQALCLAIIQAKDDIARAIENWKRGHGVSSTDTGSETAATPKGKQKLVDPKVLMERDYAIACEKLCFAHVPLSSDDSRGGLSYPTHAYAEDLRSTASSTRIPKKRLHLIKELSGMATSLPPGIWIRVDEVRNDVIKIMIAGPEGTPYAGGLYEFDCFLPLNYPAVSPQVKLRTTGGGTVRFNPNLYNDGKVCLSLLGTWPGQPEEMWQPNKSTLLQVLISIQSMIMIETPYFNEPGFGQADPNNPSSIAYNKNIALQNVRWAMVDWMKDEHKKGLWAEIIASHFSIRKDIIREQIVAWAAQDSTFKNYPFPRVSRDERDLLKAFDSGAKLVQGWKPRK
ncbi:hypothetical protein DL93DRAFT_2123554 [Clavulina sp. PMI_390]|nr:hypothetical protein DL93DRAFT_2123554 [Clavulina sp. PMI_390]